MQLREKQKVRRYYGVLETQFHKHYVEAERRGGVTGDNLLQILESRLDNVVYRMGFADSPRAGAPARPSRPLHGQRPQDQHPFVPGPPGRRDLGARQRSRSKREYFKDFECRSSRRSARRIG